MKSACTFVVCALAATSPLFAAGFKVLDTTIDPAPNQRIVIEATGGDQVQGMDLTVAVTGAPLAITDISVEDSMWTGNSLEPVVFVYPSEGFPNAQYGVLYMITASGTVTASGVAATVIVDATGLDGQTAVITANYSEAPSDWAGGPIDGYVDGTITIRSSDPPANQPPVVNAGADQTVTAGDLVVLSATASDPEEASLTYAWTQIAGPQVSLSSQSVLSPSFVAPQVDAQTQLEFRLSVSDGTNTRTDSVVVTVNPAAVGNQPPTVGAGADQAVVSGALVQLTGSAVDPENAAMTYLWVQIAGPPVILSSTSIVNPTFTAPTVSTATAVELQFRANDGTNTLSDSVVITVSPETTLQNQPPTVNAGADQTVASGTLVQLAGSAVDPENATLTYLWVQIAGPPVILSSTSTINPTFTAPTVLVATTIELQFRANDGTNTRTNTVLITVNPLPIGGNDDDPTDPLDPPVDDNPDDTDPPPPPTGGTNTDPPPTGGTTDPGVTPPPGSDNTQTDNGNTDPNNSGGSSDDVDDELENVPPTTVRGMPACAMGIAEATLFACAGFWLMLVKPVRWHDRIV